MKKGKVTVKRARKTTSRKQPGPGAPAAAAGRGVSLKTRAGASPGKPGKRRGRSRTAPGAPARLAGAGFPVVGIGASAGGLEALEELFRNMPEDSNMAFVIVTHQHPGHTSLLPEILGKSTRIPVAQARDGQPVEPNRVYVGPPGGNLAILKGTLYLMETGEEKAPRLPIDHFFRSLAQDQKERAVGIVLSGTGTDGTLGVKEIKGESGMVMVEQPQSARYAGMPSSAIATGLADYILSPAAMPAQLMSYVKGPYLEPAPALDTPAIDGSMRKMLILIRNRTGHDFSSYKPSTIRRRIERRMNVHQIKRSQDYLRYLQENAHEIDILFKELLISVTSFFRDAEFWEALAAGPLPRLLQARPDGFTFRVWVPGCASGEEAYSLAVLLRECMEKLDRHLEVQIYGTDLDAESVELARAGLYPDGIAVDVTPRRLERYFVREEGNYRIRKEIRETVIFAQQNVLRDPPFTRLDLLCCRNLLIYLNADLQKRLIPLFHYSLRPGGLLLLGSSETIGGHTDLFDSLDKRWKIYSRKEAALAGRAALEMPVQKVEREPEAAPLPPAAPPGEAHISRQVERLLLARFAPPSIVVNDRGDIVYIHGRTGAYLEPAQGQPRNNVLEMAREGLQIELASALRQAAARDREVVRERVRVRDDGGQAEVDLRVSKIREPETLRGLLLITVSPPAALPAVLPRAPRIRGKRERGGERVEQLERELRYTRESLHTTVEELETSNEELKSANEELQSTNEELQSTNEELETSKEEMQSLNEELTTVNAELQSKLDDLTRANDDMQNLLDSTVIATVFLDNELKIKRYTDEATRLITLRKSDIGRPLRELASMLDYDGLLSDCDEVLKTLAYREREVSTREGACYLMRIVPYRTADNVIDGLVLTFVSLDRLKLPEQELRSERAFFESIVDTVREPLVVLDPELRLVSANRSFYRGFRLRPRQVQGERIYDVGGGAWNIPELRELLEEILPKRKSLEHFEVDHDFPRVGRKILFLNARRLERNAGQPGMILLAMEEASGG